MTLTLTTHDTRFDDPDAATIAKVLASLDGDRHALVTLGRSDLTYVQASGSAHDGPRPRVPGGLPRPPLPESVAPTLPLEMVTDIFQCYARDDESWRNRVPWEHVPYVPQTIPWHSTWVGYIVILLIVVALVWLWRGW